MTIPSGVLNNGTPRTREKKEQAGAELCQAQEKLGLANKLIWSFTSKQIEVVVHFSKIRVVFYLPLN